jgi:hypothetical protein
LIPTPQRRSDSKHDSEGLVTIRNLDLKDADKLGLLESIRHERFIDIADTFFDGQTCFLATALDEISLLDLTGPKCNALQLAAIAFQVCRPPIFTMVS